MMDMQFAGGPLAGVKVVEFAGVGPGPFCAMLLADYGASVVQIVRPGAAPSSPLIGRHRETVALDLKQPADRAAALRIVGDSDVLLEGFRPGVMERLLLGPAECHAVKDKLVYTRLTGWGQSGELRDKAGHDINYIAMAGVLGSIGGDKPVVPLNLIGDYAGGALLAAFGVLAALRSAEKGVRHLVVDSSMRAGAAYLMSQQFEQLSVGTWQDKRGSNLLDGSAPFYDSYVCADGEWVAVGAIEDKFYGQLLVGLQLESLQTLDRFDVKNHDRIRNEFGAAFRRSPRAHWMTRFRHLDACVSPVLSMCEVASDGTMVRERVSGMLEPRPNPVISGRMPDDHGHPNPRARHNDAAPDWIETPIRA
jgi:alpha-methylacyl-CoA racemase